MKQKSCPKVSVLIPAFNEEKYVIKTLEALISQDYSNFEIIVADNNSTDQTVELIKDFIWENEQNSPIIKLTYEFRAGTNFAREAARKLATGEILAQLDADCVPCKSWISKGVNALKTQHAIAASGPYDYHDTFKFRRYFTLAGQMVLYPFINNVIQYFKRGGLLIGGNTFVYANVMEQIGGYNTSLTFYGDDIDIAAQLISFGYICYTPKLILKTSCRRFTALGFSKVQKKYRKFFWDLILYKKMNVHESCELVHPR